MTTLDRSDIMMIMIFHSIDNKTFCKSIVVDNKIIDNPSYKDLTGSWDYNMDHKNSNIQYAKLYLQGKSIDEACPGHLKADWEKTKKKHAAFIKSFKVAHVKASSYCFYDLVPESFLLEYFGHKCKIVEHILKTYEKPNNYDYLLELTKLTREIEQQPVNLNLKALTPLMYKAKTRSFREKLARVQNRICYNVFGTKTGRLTTKKGSFPILTLDRDYRNLLIPSNDYFLELDFNGAELRCLLGLNEMEQPHQDIHDWHSEEIYKSSGKQITRDEIKKKIFSWLYGGVEASLGIPAIETYYNKRQVLNKYWDGDKIVNPFGREIQADEFHALNFLIQSTTSDLFLRRAIAVNNLLKNRKSRITALIHDSMLIDLDREDKEIIPELVKTMESTELGKFKVNKKVGLDFGSLRSF